MPKKIKIIEVDKKPVCPFCEKELEKLERLSFGMFEIATLIICPHCRKVLCATGK